MDSPAEQEEVKGGESDECCRPTAPEDALAQQQASDADKESDQRAGDARIAQIGRPQQTGHNIGQRERVAVTRERKISGLNEVARETRPAQDNEMQAHSSEGDEHGDGY